MVLHDLHRDDRDVPAWKPRRGAAVLLPLMLFLLAVSLPVHGQDTPRDVRAKAQAALSQGAFADAIGYLQQLIEWFGDSKKDITITQMESVYFSLGTCNFFVGQFSDAREVFATYLKKYRTGFRAAEASLYSADCFRFEQRLPEALKAYTEILKKYELTPDMKADIFMSMARCYLALDKWDKAVPVLRKLYSTAPDFGRRNWAASLLTAAYLKEMQTDKVFQLVPFLLVPNSFASRSVALNMAALEAGDNLFADEKYRDALWVYRLVYPHDVLKTRSEQYLEVLQKQAERLKRTPDNPRYLMRVQEQIGELEVEIKALATIENYDLELFFRMARAYMEIRRFREACDLFVHLHETAPEPRANEALFFAFECAMRLQPWDRALTLGLQYMEKYPAGEYYDDVSLSVGQIYARQEDWPNVISILTKALEVSPKHKQGAECMFLIGYASFMDEKFPEAVTWLKKLNDTFPGHPREADATYWTGMAFMFDRKFEEAAVEFDKVIARFPDCPFIQDALFRRAVCEYGLSKFETAEPMLEKFIASYPENKLCGEAYMMLGDISGVFGEIKKAVLRYREVARYEINIEFYNYAAFRCAELLDELNDYKGLIRDMQDYITQNREGCNIPLAMYWVGKSMWNMNEQRGALEYFRDGIEKYGVDRKSLGIDLIIEEWIGRSRSAAPDVAKGAWKDMALLLDKAVKTKLDALALRLKRMFLYQPDLPEEQKKAALQDLTREENISKASPGVLELMLDAAIARGDTNLALRVAEATIKDFTETDYALSARMYLARTAIERKDYKMAIKQLTVIREVYATSAEAADALMLLGELYSKQNKYAEADECYKSVLGVRDWRGPLWPAAIYGRGECARQQRNYEQAAAYYERIYLMYSQYREWTAKAYLARSDCLVRIRQYQKAAETLAEMVASQDLQDLPEMEEARKKLQELKTKGL
jgi:TolA-binding protein